MLGDAYHTLPSQILDPQNELTPAEALNLNWTIFTETKKAMKKAAEKAQALRGSLTGQIEARRASWTV